MGKVSEVCKMEGCWLKMQTSGGLLMIRMRVAAENDLDVGEREAKRLDRREQQRRGVLVVRVDQDVTLRRSEEIRVQRSGPDVVEVPDDRVRRERDLVLGPVLLRLRLDKR